MASIRKRAPRTPGGKATYQVRYRDPAGVQRSRSFATSTRAREFKVAVEADLQRGSYVDYSLGAITLANYSEEWLSGQTFAESTREQTEMRLRLHILPTLGSTPLNRLRRSQIQSWVRSKQADLSEQTIHVVVSLLSSILRAAVTDELIQKHPFPPKTLTLPAIPESKIVPWPESQVAAMRAELPDRYVVLLALITGLGLRQGEVFGLAVGDIDFLKRTVRVQRQVKIVRSKLVFDLPKRKKVRDVPLPASIANLLSAYLQSYPPMTVTLPWEKAGGSPTTAKLLVTSREGGALNKNYINRSIWRPALVRAGLPLVRENMMHGGRHFYASVQLEGGLSIRALADYLGHKDVGFTLKTYTHLMPQSVDKAKRAVDDVFDRLENGSISPLSGPNVAQGPL